MAEELIRKVCEAANCKYPDMEAMADFRREVAPAAVIGLLDGLRHAKGVAALNDARANGAAETVQHLRSELATMRRTLPQPAAAEVVARIIESPSAIFPSVELTQSGVSLWGTHDLMTVSQHQRILAAATHPADQVADDLTMVKVPRELPAWLDDKHALGEKLYSIGWRGLADAQYCGAERLLEELRALLAKSEGVKK